MCLLCFTASRSRACLLVLALALGGCAAGVADGPAGRAVARAPAGFAVPLARGTPAIVGVYGAVRGVAPSEVPTGSTAAAEPGTRAPWSDADLRLRIGAGFFISKDGLIVTAAHVVADVPTIIVKLADQRIMTAEFIAADTASDIALIKIDHTLAEPPPMGNSASLRPGDWVLAVGEPYGLHRTVVAGIVGGRGRHFAEDAELVFIQSDLLLNPGNSGGPLLDMRGDIVGMNLRTVVGSYGSPGLSLSVPIEVVRQIADELAGRGRIARPRLGAGFEDVSPFSALAAARPYATGALINSVEPGSVAARLGLHQADIVVGMNDHAIGDSADLARVLLSWRRVEGTKLTVFRGGAYRQLSID